MKKLLLLFSIALFTATSYAQYKPAAGSINTEVGFSLSSDANNISLSGLKLRYFMNDNLALRLNTNFNYSRVDAGAIDRATFFALSLGAEHHFDVAPRLSPYVGAQVGFFTNSTYSGTGPASMGNGTHNLDENGNPVFAGFEAALLSGFDFYVYKGLYAGAEFGLYYTSASSRGWTNEQSEVGPSGEISASEFKFIAMPSIRLGWSF